MVCSATLKGIYNGNEKYKCPFFISTADFEEVVRCKDCEHCIYWADEKNCSCNLHHIRTNRDDFCSYGKRRTE